MPGKVCEYPAPTLWEGVGEGKPFPSEIGLEVLGGLQLSECIYMPRRPEASADYPADILALLSCLYPASIVPISCPYPAYILPLSCLYPAYILPISCLYPAYPASILSLYCRSCLYHAYILLAYIQLTCLYLAYNQLISCFSLLYHAHILPISRLNPAWPAQILPISA